MLVPSHSLAESALGVGWHTGCHGSSACLPLLTVSESGLCSLSNAHLVGQHIEGKHPVPVPTCVCSSRMALLRR